MRLTEIAFDIIKNINYNSTSLFNLNRGTWKNSDVVCQDAIKNVFDASNKLEPWALNIIDASTKVPSGMLTGNIHDLGNFDQCIEVKSANGLFQGQHCQAAYSLNTNVSLMQNSLDYSPAVKWSYCIPSVCNASQLQNALSNIIDPDFINVTVLDSECLMKQSNENWSPGVFVSIIMCSIVLLLCVASTLYDLWKRHFEIVNTIGRQQKDIFVAFSFYTNAKRLFSLHESQDTMGVLYGLRGLSMIWIILGHRYYFSITSPMLNLLNALKETEAVQTQLIINGGLAVDTFFFISGFLNAYHLMTKLQTTRKFPIVYFYLHRYFRIVPPLAAVILITVGWYNLLGDGPLWQSSVGTNKMLCERYWWPTLLFINNYYNPITQCAGQSWYLAVDMQLYWLSPLIIIPCWKWPRITKFYVPFLAILSVVTVFLISYFNNIRAAFSLSQNLEEYRLITREIYVPTHTRATPYIMGIMLGLVVQEIRKSNRKLNISQGVLFFGWIFSTLICLSVVLGNYQFMQTTEKYPYNKIQSSFYISLHRVGWSVGIGWIILVCVQGYGGIVNSILSSYLFIPFGRLTYCIFLCHMMVQQYELGTTRTTGYYSKFEHVHSFFGDVVAATLASVILCLMFESPVSVIEKYFLQGKSDKKVRDIETKD